MIVFLIKAGDEARLFMKRATNAVAAKVFDNRKTVFVRLGFDGVADAIDLRARAGLKERFTQRAPLAKGLSARVFSARPGNDQPQRQKAPDN